MKRLTLLLPFLLAGCSNYEFNTNLDKQNFSDYFAVSDVNYYEANALTDYYVEQLGMIETEDCQPNLDFPPAEQKNAMIEAKRAAAKLGANGVIVNSCIAQKPSNQCLTSYLCYSNAIKVTPLTSNSATE